MSMQKVRDIAEAIKLYPRIQLGKKMLGGGVMSTGPHKVKFVEEPMVILGKDHEGNPRKEFKFILEESLTRYRWHVPILNKEGQPNYLVERLMEVEVGDVRILEMKKRGRNNYIDITIPGEPTDEEIDEKMDEVASDPALVADREQIGDIEEIDPTAKAPF